MDNAAENSDASSDENAMVIDETYEEMRDLSKDDLENVGKEEVSEDVIEGDGNESASEQDCEEDDDDDDDDDSDPQSDGDEEGEEGDMTEGDGEDEEDEWESEEEAAEGMDAETGLVSDSDDELESCPICLNKFRGQDVGNPESCDHNFCLECIMEWSNNVNTCPVDRQVFHLILAKHADCESVYKRFPVEDKNMNEVEEEDDLTYCEVCHQCDREDRLLLCDGCDKGYHCECLDPALDSVPIEEWFCPDCAETRGRGRRAASPAALEEAAHGTDRVPVQSPLRRMIPRTQASERVRTRIQANRAAIAQMLESEDELAACSSSSVSPRKRPRKKTTKRKSKVRRKGKGKIKRKKTTRRGTKRRKSRAKKKSSKITRKKPTVKSSSDLAGSMAVPSMTPKARIAGRLGLSKPPVGRTIPMQKVQQEKTIDGQRTAIGISQLSITGNRDELLSFHDGDVLDSPEEPQASTCSASDAFSHTRDASVKYSASALKSHRPLIFTRNISEQSKPTVVKASDISRNEDVLGSIMKEQVFLGLKGKDVTIHSDGSLTAKADVSNPGDSFKNAELKDSTTDKSIAQRNCTNEKNEITKENVTDDNEKSPYTDSDEGTQEPVLMEEQQHSNELVAKSPCASLSSPAQESHKSAEQDSGPVSPSGSEKLKQACGDPLEDIVEKVRASVDVAEPVLDDSAGLDQSSSKTLNVVECDGLSGSQCSGKVESSEDTVNPIDNCTAIKTDSAGEERDGRAVIYGLEKDAAVTSPVKEPVEVDHVLGVDSDDSSKEDPRPRIPISELPRIPKKKKLPNPIEVITIEDDDDEEEANSDDQNCSVLQRLDVADRKNLSVWEKKETKGKLEDGKRPEIDRFEKRGQRSDRRKDSADDDERYRVGLLDRRRVVLNERGGLIVRTEDLTHGESALSNKKHGRPRSRSRSRERHRNHSRSRERARESHDKPRLKDEHYRSQSRDGSSRRKRRHERSRSGSRSDHERHEKSHRHKKKKHGRSSESRGLDKRAASKEDSDHHTTGRRTKSDSRNNRADSKGIPREKSESREKDKDRSLSKNESKFMYVDMWKEKRDVASEQIDLRDRLENRSKNEAKDRCDNTLNSDLREKFGSRLSDRTEGRLKTETLSSENFTEKDKRSHCVSDSQPIIELNPEPMDTVKQAKHKHGEFKLGIVGKDLSDVKEIKSLSSQAEDHNNCPVSVQPARDSLSESVGKGALSDNVQLQSSVILPTKKEQKLSSVFHSESSFPKPPLPTPSPFVTVEDSSQTDSQVDAMYDPSVPTDTTSPPPIFDHKDMEDLPPDMNTLGVQQRPEFIMGSRLQSPSGAGLLSDGSFLLTGDPNMINVLQRHQNIGPIPMSLGMLAPGFPAGIPTVPPRPHLVVNPLLLNRPPPFARLPQMTRAMHRFSWPGGVDHRGVFPVPNRFDASGKEQGIVQIQNRFPGPFPSTPSPVTPHSNLVNGGFEALPADSAGGPQHFPPVFSVREDPRQSLIQQPMPTSAAEPVDKPLMDPSQTTQTKSAPIPSNPLNEISRLLNLQAQLVGLTKKGDSKMNNRSGKDLIKQNDASKSIFKVPLPPSQGYSGAVGRPSLGSKVSPGGQLGGGGCETTEVVDMDMSPLDDDDNIVVSPDYEQGENQEKEDKVSSVMFLNKPDDLPSSAVELTNKQKAGKYMKKLHLQERVVEEVKLAIKPFYAGKKITKEEYKDILRKSVPKICHSKSGNINPAKIKCLIEAYVEKVQRSKKKKTNPERVKSRHSR